MVATKPNLIPIAKPLLDQEEIAAITRALNSGWVSQGPEVAAFEQEFAAYVGSNYACAVSSCTTALHLALLAVGVQPGDEVVTVSHSFIATANAIRYCQALPIFVDIDPQTFNVNPQHLEAAISPRTRAILAVHQLGMPCDLKAILAIAQAHGLPVVEDAACAIGSQIHINEHWQNIGCPHGDIACFSFHPRKVITTGDGGMLTTNNPEYDRQFRLWRQHGMSVPDTVRHAAPQVIFESYSELGFNYRMTDIQAAIGRVQLQRLPDIIAQRRALGERYHTLLSYIPGLGLPTEPQWARTNWQSYAVKLPIGLEQKSVMQALLDRGISSRRGVMCIHREPAYPPGTWSCMQRAACQCPPHSCEMLQESREAQDRCIILPLYPEMTDKEQMQVVDTLKQVIHEQECSHGS